jgi:hypothetical protein
MSPRFSHAAQAQAKQSPLIYSPVRSDESDQAVGFFEPLE